MIQIPRYHAHASIAAGNLLCVLEDYPPTSTLVSILYLRNRQLSPRVRVFADWLAAIFKERG